MSRTTKHHKIKTFDTLQAERKCRKFMDNGGFEKLSRIRQEQEISDMEDTTLYKTL